MATRLKDAGPRFLIPKVPPKRKMDRRLKDPDYLAFLHDLECCVSGETANLTVQHIMAGRESYGKKEDDSVCVPLARDLHLHDFGANSLERLTERVFWNRCGIDALALARDLRTLWETHGAAKAHAFELIRMHRNNGQIRKRQGIKVFAEKIK